MLWHHHRWVIMLLLCFGWALLPAQSNPFELKQRIKEQVAEPDTTAREEITNPFHIDRDGVVPRRENEPVFQAPNLLKQKWHAGGFIFGLVAVLILLLVVITAFGRTMINEFFQGVSGRGHINILFRHYANSFSPVLLLLYLFFFINLGLFIFLFVTDRKWLAIDSGWWIISAAGILAVLFLLKHFVVRSIGWIFSIEKHLSKYNFELVVFNCVLGLGLFPINLVILYAPDVLKQGALVAGIVIIILTYTYRYLFTTFVSGQLVLRNKLNFFLYLCTVEIAPMVIIFKIVSDRLGQGF